MVPTFRRRAAYLYTSVDVMLAILLLSYAYCVAPCVQPEAYFAASLMSPSREHLAMIVLT
jgi:hypothetical protein